MSDAACHRETHCKRPRQNNFRRASHIHGADAEGAGTASATRASNSHLWERDGKAV